MKLSIFVRTALLAVALSSALPAVAATDAPDVAWHLGPTLPLPLARFDGELVGSRVYFLGGRTNTLPPDDTVGNVLYLDVPTRTFGDTGVVMPVPISNYGVAKLEDANGTGLYVFGGRDAAGGVVTDVQVYYPASNTAAVVDTDPWPGTTDVAGCISLPAMGVAVVGNKAYVMGGASFLANGCQDDNSSQTWVFNPNAPAGSRWQQGPDLNLARGYVTPAVLGNKLMAIGGDVNNVGALEAQSIVEGLNTANPTAWNDAAVADLPMPCDESQAFGFTSGPLKGNVVLAGCGNWPDQTSPDTLVFAGGSWHTSTPLNDVRRNHAGVLVTPNRMLVLGGYAQDGATIIDSSEHSKAVPFAPPRARDSARAGKDVPLN